MHFRTPGLARGFSFSASHGLELGSIRPGAEHPRDTPRNPNKTSGDIGNFCDRSSQASRDDLACLLGCGIVPGRKEAEPKEAQMTEFTLEDEEQPLDEEGRERDERFIEYVGFLARAAHRAIHLNDFSPDSFVVVCIKVEKKTVWRELADTLVPGQDWAEHHDKGEEPIVFSCVSKNVCAWIAEVMPELAEGMDQKPGNGKVQVIMLDDAGCTIYELEPRSGAALN